jgi:2-isopropylmalate synthase
VGIDSNIVSASLKAITSGLHRARRQGQLQFAQAALA